MSLRNLQNALQDLVRIRIWFRSGLGSGLWLCWDRVRFRSESCACAISKLRMRDFKIAQRILQIARIERKVNAEWKMRKILQYRQQAVKCVPHQLTDCQ